MPFLRSVMPQEFSAVLVKGRSNYIGLRRLDAAMRRPVRAFQPRRGVRPARRGPALGGRPRDGSRSDLDFTPFPTVWEAVSERGRQLPRQEVPPVQGVLLLQGPAAGSGRPTSWSSTTRLFMTDLAVRAAGGGGMLPKYDVAIIDEAHTLEAVAGEHLGLKVSSMGRSSTR